MALRLGLVGYDIASSLSPKLHGELGRWADVDLTYDLIDVVETGLAEAVNRLRCDKFDGFNVTAPYKSNFVPLVHELTPSAERTGAVNTVILQDDGTWVGDNTDVYGIRHVLMDRKIDRALILGAGGVARAALEAFRGHGVSQLTVVNRTLARARALAGHFRGLPVKTHSWIELDALNEDFDLIINSIPCSVLSKSRMFQSRLKDWTSLWLELSYGVDAQAWGCTLSDMGVDVIDGRYVLVHQGRRSFSAWTGISIPAHVAEMTLNL